MAVAMIGPKFYAWDRNGKPLAFGKLYTYQARTNTPKVTYQSEDQIVQNANPVILNGEGYADIYLDGAYKMVLKDKDDNEIWSSDPVSSAQPTEWVNCNTADYVSPTTFRVGGNLTDQFEVGRACRIDNASANYSYSTIKTSTFAAGETTVELFEAVVTTSISNACVQIIGNISDLYVTATGTDTPRKLADRFTDYANVKDFGVVGDGVTDDSDAFIAMCSSPINVIGNPEDTYLLTKPIDVKDNSVIDLQGATVKWNGVAPSQVIIGRDRGIFEVRGTVGAVLDTVTPSGDWEDGTNRFPITVGSDVPDTKFVRLTGGSLPDAYMSYMISPSLDQNDANRIIADYFLGYTLPTPTFSYVEIIARENVVIKNFNIEDLTSPVNDAEDISGIVLQYASNCHVLNVNAKSTNNPVVFGYYTSDCTVEKGFLDTPNKTSGGKGYFVQWNNALRCASKRLTGKKTRHISDFTTAAFCSTEDCGGENTLSGEFTTHGAYEHNLDYVRTRGFLSFAGSGSTFGDSAKNITVRNHIGSDIRARTNVENMHLIDCETNYAVLNVVDLVVEGLKLYDTEQNVGRLQVNNWSRSLSKPYEINKAAVIRDSNIKSGDTVYLFEPGLNTDKVIIENCDVFFRTQHDFGGGSLTFKYCDVESAANINSIDAIQMLHFIECDAVNLGFRTNSRGVPLDFKIQGGSWSGNNSSGQMFSFRDGGTVAGNKWAMENVNVDWDGSDTIEAPSSFTNPNWDIKLITNEFSNGNLSFRPTQFPFRSIANTFSNGAAYSPSTLGSTRISEHNITGL